MGTGVVRQLPGQASRCRWCGRPSGFPLPLHHAAGPGSGVEAGVPHGVCDICAGLLGCTPYDPRLDGPHALADAYSAVHLLTGAEPLTAGRSRRRCRWCSRPASSGWCPTCAVLLAAAAHAAGRTLLPGPPPSAIHTAYRTVTQSSDRSNRATDQPEPGVERRHG